MSYSHIIFPYVHTCGPVSEHVIDLTVIAFRANYQKIRHKPKVGKNIFYYVNAVSQVLIHLGRNLLILTK